MTTKCPIWNDYIKFYTTRPATLTIVPKATQAASVEPPAIMVSRYLGTRRVDKPDGSHVIREMWSHASYEFVGYIGTQYARIQDRYGVLTLPIAQVRMQDNTKAKAA